MVVGLAANETKRFTGHIEAIGPEHVGALEMQAREFLQGNFVSLRLYGIDKRKILEAFEPGKKEPRRSLPEHVHNLSAGELDHHHMLWVDGRILMQMHLPVAGGDGTARGYFEGVYQVDADTLGDIKAGIIDLGTDPGHRRPIKLAARSARHRGVPPREIRRQRISEGARGRGHPPWSQSLRDHRRVRRACFPEALQGPLAVRRGDDHPGAWSRHALRCGASGCVQG